MENLNRNLELIKMAQEYAVKTYLSQNPHKELKDLYVETQWEDEIEYSFIPEVNVLINTKFIELYNELNSI